MLPSWVKSAMIALFLAQIIFLRAVTGNSLDNRQSELPTSRRRRGFQSMAVLGSYLYITGGDIASWDTVGPDDFVAINGTSAIALNVSWDNSSVEIIVTESDARPLVKERPALWTDAERNTIYQWGGEVGFRDDAEQENHLWEFSPDGNGSGTWSTSSPSNPETFRDILQGDAGPTAFCGGYGLYLGGAGNPSTDNRFRDVSYSNGTPIPGLLKYNASSRAWSNESAVAYSFPHGTSFLGQATCVTGFRSNALFVPLGGHDVAPGTANERQIRSFNNITMYNPVDGRWYWQQTSGTPPGGRDLFCMVGVASRNTFEIFVYGGRGTDGYFNDIHILSIPAFQWFRVPVSSPTRIFHACALAGNRQMIVSGGINSDWDWRREDEWTNSLGVFDLSSLEWRSNYDADALEYESPEVVRSWYQEGNTRSIIWSSDSVRDLFIPQSQTDESTTTSSSTLPTTATTSSAPTDSTTSPSDSIGVIVGATLGSIGAVVILVLVGVIIAQRRGQAQRRGSKEKSRPRRDELLPDQLHYTPVLHEVDINPNRGPELDSNARSELQG
ncbi:hypothetical protein B0I35DRAFT_425772 [Stachybotrys elegans]|uniref:Kelch repeat protein n=1 Tax=Stachybotrys elegans TaxID=80388 RepID=A0A8K0SWJ4_9HYPO|nr:hypothetical protein B0I35DRAFT_425772 [Stachybotrys elegans]